MALLLLIIEAARLLRVDSSRSKESLIDAGFVSISALKSQEEVADFATLARGLVYGSPIIDQVRQRGGVEAERIVAAIVGDRKEFGVTQQRHRFKPSYFLPRSPPTPNYNIHPR